MIKAMPLHSVVKKVKYTPKIQRKDFLNSGKFPIISQEQDFINGYWNSETDVYKVDNPVVIFGDHTKVIKYVDFDFVLGADGVKILDSSSEIDPKYLYHALNALEMPDLGYARHWTKVKDLEIACPDSISHQQEIAKRLDGLMGRLDEAEKLVQQNIENVERLRESLSDYEVYTKNVSYEMAILGKIAPYSVDRIDNAELDESSYVGVDNLLQKFEGKADSEYLPTNGRSTKYYEGDVLMSNIRPYLEKAWLADSIGGASGDVIVFHPDRTKILGSYLYYVISSKRFVDYVMSSTTGTKMPRGNKKQIPLFEVPLPPLEAQQQIVQTLDKSFSAFQKLKVQYADKLLKIQQLKRSILDDAFKIENLDPVSSTSTGGQTSVVTENEVLQDD